jgi:uncharacterized membrane protein YccC
LAGLFVLAPGSETKYPNGYWAALTVAFVAGDTVGGTFHQSVLRWHGTVAGAIVGCVNFDYFPRFFSCL